MRDIIGYFAGAFIASVIIWFAMDWVWDNFINGGQNIGGVSGESSGKFVVEREPAVKTNEYGTSIITGQIRNISGKFLDYTHVSCQIYDDRVQIDSTSDSTSGIAAGASWRYEARWRNGSPDANYEIECQADSW